MNETYYKVVRVRDDGWHSFSGLRKMDIRYYLLKWAVPKVGRIFLFKELKDAEKFADQNRCLYHTHFILSGKALFARKVRSILATVMSSDSIGVALSFWIWEAFHKKYVPDGFRLDVTPAPDGTYGALAFKPMEVVHALPRLRL